MEKYKIMRMLCMFDLPVETEEQRRAYRIFRKESYTGRVCDDPVFHICESLPKQRICATGLKTGSRKVFHRREMCVCYVLPRNSMRI